MTKQEFKELDELLEKNKDVLIRLRTLNEEYYTQERFLKSFEEVKKGVDTPRT